MAVFTKSSQSDFLVTSSFCAKISPLFSSIAFTRLSSLSVRLAPTTNFAPSFARESAVV